MKFFKKNRGQNVAEYAILIALVVGAVIAMQKFAQRGLQARMRDATKYMVDKTNDEMGGGYGTGQYEPYYQDSSFDSTRDETEFKSGTGNKESLDSNSDSKRNGYQQQQMNGTIGSGLNF